MELVTEKGLPLNSKNYAEDKNIGAKNDHTLSRIQISIEQMMVGNAGFIYQSLL